MAVLYQLEYKSLLSLNLMETNWKAGTVFLSQTSGFFITSSNLKLEINFSYVYGVFLKQVAFWKI